MSIFRDKFDFSQIRDQNQTPQKPSIHHKSLNYLRQFWPLQNPERNQSVQHTFYLWSGRATSQFSRIFKVTHTACVKGPKSSISLRKARGNKSSGGGGGARCGHTACGSPFRKDWGGTFENTSANALPQVLPKSFHWEAPLRGFPPLEDALIRAKCNLTGKTASCGSKIPDYWDPCEDLRFQRGQAAGWSIKVRIICSESGTRWRTMRTTIDRPESCAKIRCWSQNDKTLIQIVFAERSHSVGVCSASHLLWNKTLRL